VPAEVQGKSLVGLIKGERQKLQILARPSSLCESDYPHIAFGWSALQSLRTEIFIHTGAARELYDQTVDPEAEHNLAATSAAVADTLGGKVRAIQERTTSKRPHRSYRMKRLLALGSCGAGQARIAWIRYVGQPCSQIVGPGARSEGQDWDDQSNSTRQHLMADEHYSEAIPVLQK